VLPATVMVTRVLQRIVTAAINQIMMVLLILIMPRRISQLPARNVIIQMPGCQQLMIMTISTSRFILVNITGDGTPALIVTEIKIILCHIPAMQCVIKAIIIRMKIVTRVIQQEENDNINEKKI